MSPESASDPGHDWARAEELVIERATTVGWWEAARWAAGHERENPPLSARALHAWVVQTATNTDRLAALEAAHRRIRRAVSSRLWAGGNGDGPVDAIDEESVDEVFAAVVATAQDAFTALALRYEVEAGVLPPKRRQQLEGARLRVTGH
jgi:hypothetical protein